MMMIASWTTSSAVVAYILHCCPLACPISCLGACSISTVASSTCLYWPYLWPVGPIWILGLADPVALMAASHLSFATLRLGWWSGEKWPLRWYKQSSLLLLRLILLVVLLEVLLLVSWLHQTLGRIVPHLAACKACSCSSLACTRVAPLALWAHRVLLAGLGRTEYVKGTFEPVVLLQLTMPFHQQSFASAIAGPIDPKECSFYPCHQSIQHPLPDGVSHGHPRTLCLHHYLGQGGT